MMPLTHHRPIGLGLAAPPAPRIDRTRISRDVVPDPQLQRWLTGSIRAVTSSALVRDDVFGDVVSDPIDAPGLWDVAAALSEASGAGVAQEAAQLAARLGPALHELLALMWSGGAVTPATSNGGSTEQPLRTCVVPFVELRISAEARLRVSSGYADAAVGAGGSGASIHIEWQAHPRVSWRRVGQLLQLPASPARGIGRAMDLEDDSLHTPHAAAREPASSIAWFTQWAATSSGLSAGAGADVRAAQAAVASLVAGCHCAASHPDVLAALPAAGERALPMCTCAYGLLALARNHEALTSAGALSLDVTPLASVDAGWARYRFLRRAELPPQLRLGRGSSSSSCSSLALPESPQSPPPLAQGDTNAIPTGAALGVGCAGAAGDLPAAWRASAFSSSSSSGFGVHLQMLASQPAAALYSSRTMAVDGCTGDSHEEGREEGRVGLAPVFVTAPVKARPATADAHMIVL